MPLSPSKPRGIPYLDDQLVVYTYNSLGDIPIDGGVEDKNGFDRIELKGICLLVRAGTEEKVL